MAFTSYSTFELAPTTSSNGTTKTVSVSSVLGVYNAGPNRAYVKHGSGSQTASTTPQTGYDFVVEAGMYREEAVGTSDGFAAICASGSATLFCNLKRPSMS